jgi:hypothetical protein
MSLVGGELSRDYALHLGATFMQPSYDYRHAAARPCRESLPRPPQCGPQLIGGVC